MSPPHRQKTTVDGPTALPADERSCRLGSRACNHGCVRKSHSSGIRQSCGPPGTRERILSYATNPLGNQSSQNVSTLDGAHSRGPHEKLVSRRLFRVPTLFGDLNIL